jgi:hypothetical protein
MTCEKYNACSTLMCKKGLKRPARDLFSTPVMGGGGGGRAFPCVKTNVHTHTHTFSGGYLSLSRPGLLGRSPRRLFHSVKMGAGGTHMKLGFMTVVYQPAAHNVHVLIFPSDIY